MKQFGFALVLALGTAATVAFAQEASPGAWKLSGTNFSGYFQARSVQPDGTVRGDNPDTVYAGASAVLAYEFSLASWAGNGEMKADPDTCRKIEAELIANEKSVLKYFHKAPVGTLKPRSYSVDVHNHMMKPLASNTPQVMGGTTASHTRCYVRIDNYYKKPTDIMVVGVYGK